MVSPRFMDYNIKNGGIPIQEEGSGNYTEPKQCKSEVEEICIHQKWVPC